jgi:hypothetical protein
MATPASRSRTRETVNGTTRRVGVRVAERRHRQVERVADCISPAISERAGLRRDETSANVSWTTNENANSRVRYGTSVPPGSVQDDLGNYGTSAAWAQRATARTPYVFSVTSSDGAGNSVTADAGSYYAFSTMGRAYKKPAPTRSSRGAASDALGNGGHALAHRHVQIQLQPMPEGAG